MPMMSDSQRKRIQARSRRVRNATKRATERERSRRARSPVRSVIGVLFECTGPARVKAHHARGRGPVRTAGKTAEFENTLEEARFFAKMLADIRTMKRDQRRKVIARLGHRYF